MKIENFQDHERERQRNFRVETLDGVTTIYQPCPVCCAPAWVVFVADGIGRSAGEALRAGAECTSCHRAFKLVDAPPPEGVELVQTAGPDCPAWIDPPLRRIQEAVSGTA